MSFYEKGPVRIHFQEAGSGFPLLLIAGGGLNSTISNFTRNSPFNPIEEFRDGYRCIAADLRNANSGQSIGPLEIDRPWDAYTDDQLGLMDHLGIDKFMVLGFCIGGPFIWNLLKRAPDRIVAAVLAQPSGSRPEMRDHFYEGNMKTWGPELSAPARHHDRDHRKILDQDVPQQPRLRFYCDARFRPQLPDARADPAG
jgi:pimeloyl-ACP methyl ester carboxylesterase